MEFILPQIRYAVRSESKICTNSTKKNEFTENIDNMLVKYVFYAVKGGCYVLC